MSNPKLVIFIVSHVIYLLEALFCRIAEVILPPIGIIEVVGSIVAI